MGWARAAKTLLDAISQAGGLPRVVQNFAGVGGTIASNVDVVQVTSVPISDLVINLPLANTKLPGAIVVFTNPDGTCAANATVTFTRQGSDTVSAGTGVILSSGFFSVYAICDGVSKWTFRT